MTIEEAIAKYNKLANNDRTCHPEEAQQLAWSLTDIELSRDNECFDEEMLENLQYDITKEPIGLIALFYRNLWAMADLREKLREYEDLEEQGLLLRLPCKAGSTVYHIVNKRILEVENVDLFFLCLCVAECRFGKTVFLTQEEAEKKLKEMESD